MATVIEHDATGSVRQWHCSREMERSLATVIISVATVTAATVVWQFYDASLFSYHPVAMTTGYALFMTLGLLQAVSARDTIAEQRTVALRRHMYLQLAAIGCIFIGFIAIYSNKVTLLRCLSPIHHTYATQIRYGKEHFTTWHAKVASYPSPTCCPPLRMLWMEAGVGTVVLSGSTVLLGIMSFRTLGLFEILPSFVKRRVKTVHTRA